MNDKDVRKLEKTQLLFYFLVSRDNLIKLKHEICDNPDNERLREIFNEEESNYSMLLSEIYRRMK